MWAPVKSANSVIADADMLLADQMRVVATCRDVQEQFQRQPRDSA